MCWSKAGFTINKAFDERRYLHKENKTWRLITVLYKNITYETASSQKRKPLKFFKSRDIYLALRQEGHQIVSSSSSSTPWILICTSQRGDFSFKWRTRGKSWRIVQPGCGLLRLVGRCCESWLYNNDRMSLASWPTESKLLRSFTGRTSSSAALSPPLSSLTSSPLSLYSNWI